MIRIRDIADLAGVSPTTVSNVIHGNTKKVSAKSREKIEEILRRENYIPSLGARMLAGMGSGIAGVIVGPDMDEGKRGMTDPFLGEILTAVEKELYQNDMYMVFHQADSPEDIRRLVSGWQVEGIIAINLARDQILALKRRMETPLVSVDVYYEGEALPNVGLDDFGGGRLMARHMLKRGCQRLWFLSDNDEGVDRMRRLGAEKALEEARKEAGKAESGIPAGGACGLSLETVTLSHSPETRKREYESVYLKEFRKGDALFYASDYYACEGILALKRHGFDIPGDILVGGFDDNFLAAMQQPSLTTVRQDVTLKGRTAVRKLVSLIRGERPGALDTRLPVILVVRESA